MLKITVQPEGAQSGWNPRGVARSMGLLLAFAMAIPAWAQQTRTYREGNSWVEEITGTLPPAPVFRVDTAIGNISVETGGQEIRYTVRMRSSRDNEQEARRALSALRVSARRVGQFSTLEAVWTDRQYVRRFSADFTLQVPPGVGFIHIDTMGGSITVSGASARLDLGTMAGNITVGTAQGSVNAHTLGGIVNIGNAESGLLIKSGGGDITVGNAGKRVEIYTPGGNVNVNSMGSGYIQTGAGSVRVNHSSGDINVKTAGGFVNLGDMQGRVAIENGGGNIRIGSCRGNVSASTTGGNIDLWKLYRGAQVQTGTGSITIEFLGGRGSFGESYVRTAAGDVVVYLNGATPVTVHAVSEMASGHGIKSDFPQLRISTQGGDFGPKTVYADGTLNGGGPALQVRTTIGQIEFRRAR